jgi:hypothetical protein
MGLFSKRSRPTAGTVMGEVIILSDGELCELYARVRGLIAIRLGEREKDLEAVGQAHNAKAGVLRDIIEQLSKAIGWKQ